MTRTLLSPGVGIPIALLAMALLFLVELFNVSKRPRPGAARLSAVVVALVLLGLVVARFARYS